MALPTAGATVGEIAAEVPSIRPLLEPLAARTARTSALKLFSGPFCSSMATALRLPVVDKGQDQRRVGSELTTACYNVLVLMVEQS